MQRHAPRSHARLRPFGTLAVLALALGALAPAASAFFDDPADATLYTRVDGDQVQAVIEVRIEEGWYLYHTDLGPPDAIGKPTVVELGGEGIDWGPVRFPEPTRLPQPSMEPGEETWIWSHDGTIHLYAVGALQDGADPEAITAEIDGLTCSKDGTCIEYRQALQTAGAGPNALFAAFPDDLTAGGDLADGAPAGAAGGTTYRPEAGEATHGLAVYLLLAFIAGMILNVMPCVLPVISIKVLSFVQQAGESRGRVLLLGTMFALGILSVFIGLAVVAVSLGLGWGEHFQSQAFLVVMIGIVFAFALSLFGVFELGVPSGTQSIAAKLNREGPADSFFKGMLATVLATPCSGPFLGTTLAWALAQPPLTVFLIFLSLGLGMALPYVVLTANPALLRYMPRPGPWLEGFKQAMGFVLLLTVLFLMLSIRSDMLLFTNVFLVFVAGAAWWWGRASERVAGTGRLLLHLVVALAIAGGGAWVSFDWLHGKLSYEPYVATAADLDDEPRTDHTDRIAWEAFDADRLARFQGEGRNIFLVFTADWCVNCKVNEAYVYESERIRALLTDRRAVAIKADMTHGGPRTDEMRELLSELGSRAIPFLAIFPGDSPDAPVVRHDLVTRGDIAGILEGLPRPEDGAAAEDGHD